MLHVEQFQEILMQAYALDISQIFLHDKTKQKHNNTKQIW